MIRVICNQETFVYNAYHMVKAFYPSETVVSSVDEKASNYVTVEFAEDGTDGRDIFSLQISPLACHLSACLQFQSSPLSARLYHLLQVPQGRIFC